MSSNQMRLMLIILAGVRPGSPRLCSPTRGHRQGKGRGPIQGPPTEHRPSEAEGVADIGLHDAVPLRRDAKGAGRVEWGA
jgi:hypothetical protein